METSFDRNSSSVVSQLLKLKMIAAGFLLAVLLSCCQASGDEEIPFVIASQNNPEGSKVSNLLPESVEPEIPFVVSSQGNPAGHQASNLLPESDIPFVTSAQLPDTDRANVEIRRPTRGYFYPKPEIAFDLPPFTTLDVNAPLVSAFAEENADVERVPRSPRRRPSFPSPPPFIPGFIPPNQIRPLPAYYGRPGRY